MHILLCVSVINKWTRKDKSIVTDTSEQNTEAMWLAIHGAGTRQTEARELHRVSKVMKRFVPKSNETV